MKSSGIGRPTIECRVVALTNIYGALSPDEIYALEARLTKETTQSIKKNTSYDCVAGSLLGRGAPAGVSSLATLARLAWWTYRTALRFAQGRAVARQQTTMPKFSVMLRPVVGRPTTKLQREQITSMARDLQQIVNGKARSLRMDYPLYLFGTIVSINIPEDDMYVEYGRDGSYVNQESDDRMVYVIDAFKYTPRLHLKIDLIKFGFFRHTLTQSVSGVDGYDRGDVRASNYYSHFSRKVVPDYFIVRELKD